MNEHYSPGVGVHTIDFDDFPISRCTALRRWLSHSAPHTVVAKTHRQTKRGAPADVASELSNLASMEAPVMQLYVAMTVVTMPIARCHLRKSARGKDFRTYPAYACAIANPTTMAPYLPCAPQGFDHPRAAMMTYAATTLNATAAHCAARWKRNHQGSNFRPYRAANDAPGERINHANPINDPCANRATPNLRARAVYARASTPSSVLGARQPPASAASTLGARAPSLAFASRASSSRAFASASTSPPCPHATSRSTAYHVL